MVYVRSRKFCCCLPVRFGVFVMTLVGALGGGAIAIALWVEIEKNGTFETGSIRDKIIAGANAGTWSLLALVSLFGFIGTIAKRAGLVSLYATLLFLNLALSVAAGVFYIYTLFQADTKERAVDKCLNGNTSDLKNVKEDACKAGYDVLRIVLIPIFSVVWIFLLYGCIIASNYVGQLHEEEALEMSYSSHSMAKSVPAYPGNHPLQPMPMVSGPRNFRPSYNVQEAQPLASHDHNKYPYNAPQNSFGSK